MSIVESEPPIPAEINSNKTPIASISIIKLSSQIRKIIKELSIIEKSESQLNSIITALVTNYTDYQAVSLPELTQSVKGILNNLLPPSNNNPKPDTPPSSSLISKKTRAETPKSAKSSMNLNQSIINNQRSLASKRHRPEEPSLSLNPNDSQLSLSKLGGDNGERKDNATTALPSSQHREKRRKTVTSDNDTITLGHSLHNPNNNNNNNNNNSSSSFKIHKVPNSFLVDRPKARFHDLAGLENVLNQIRELVCYPLWYPQLYSHLGVSPPCGILLHGPSGCGKTTLANAIAGETGLNYFKVSGPELIGGTSGESEERIRSVFETAAANAPSILFIDALDVIAGKKESTTRGMDRRIIAQLFDSIDAISSLSRLIDSADSEQNQVTDNLSSPYPIRKIPSKSDRLNNDNPSSNSNNKLVILIVATNKPDHIDPGVRGRFAKEIALPVPDAIARTKILQLHTTGMNLSNAIDFHLLGKLTPGYVGSDLQALVREAGMIAVCRIIQSQETSVNVPTTNELHSSVDEKSQERDGTGEVVTEMEIMEEPIAGEQLIESESRPSSHQIPENSPVSIDYSTVCVEMKDFLQATKQIQPTAKREGFAVAPDISWNDIGALSEVREELKHNLLEPIAHPERFKALGLEVPAGVLFFGPPGCGKTLLAKAIANESGANFISVKGPELLNMYVGESESRVRQVFARARASAPCVIFFDELDALCPKRSSGFEGGGGNQSGNGVSERVVNQLLTELDGLETRKDVYIIAATNRLELIDDAMLRPGRLGNLLYVPLPTPSDRASILTALTRKVSISLYSDSHPDGVQLEKVAMDERAEGFSGADLSALVREAGLAVIKELSAAGNLHEPSPPSWREDQEQGEAIARVSIKSHHFEQAFQKVKPSVNRKDRVRYEKLRSYLQDGLSAIEAVKAAYEDTRDLML